MKNVGILLDDRMFRQMKHPKENKEYVSLYNRACRQAGIVPFYLSLSHMNLNNKTAVGYRYQQGRYTYTQTPIPSVIYNRAMPKSARLKAKLKRLNTISHVFNARSRYSKYEIHRMLQSEFNENLPLTREYSRTNLENMMKQHHNLYIKPVSSSLGVGIVNVTRVANGKWRIRKSGGTVTSQYKQAVAIVDRLVSRKSYLIQKAIPLVRYKGNPYDIRVVVQRNGTGAWKVTGMLGKVASKGSHVTNVSRGGVVKGVPQLFQHNFNQPKQVASKVRALSLGIARHLGSRLKNVADLGMDIGVDRSGKPYFIEANCRYQRKGFKRAGMQRTLYQIHKLPMQYANSLLKQRKM